MSRKIRASATNNTVDSADVSEASSDYVLKVPPFNYLHVLDTNSSVVRVVVGPQTFTCLDHERGMFSLYFLSSIY